MNLELGSRRLAAAWAALMLMAGSHRPLSVAEIAAALGCHRRYLESDLQQLKRAGLIEGRRGKGGGYCLAKGAARISLWDVYRVLFCAEPQRGNESSALLKAVQAQLGRLAEEVIARMQAWTLADALADARKKGAPVSLPPEDFCI